MKKKMKILRIMTIVLLVFVVFVGIYFCGLPYQKSVLIKKNNGTCQYLVYRDHAKFYKYTGEDAEVIIQDKVMGRKVTHILNMAFMGNEYVESVKCPKYLKEIGGAAFEDCSKLREVKLNEDLEVIEGGAFQRCKLLKEIIITDNVKKIGDIAFRDSGLEMVTMESENVFINCLAFYKTPWLNNQEGFAIYGDNILIGYQGNDEVVVVPDGVKILSASFFDDRSLKEVYLPNTVERILADTFWHCEDISVYIPDSVKDMSIGVIGLSEELTIVTTAGSYAESFAKENDIDYEIVDEIIYPEAN